MTTIILRYWAGARAAAGLSSETWEADSIAAALNCARRRRTDPRFDRVLSICSLLVDGQVVGPDDLDRTRTGSVQVEVLPPFAGGEASAWSQCLIIRNGRSEIETGLGGRPERP